MVASPADMQNSLKAICPRKNLFDAVQTVGHAVSGRNPLPILGHILLQAEEGGLRLIATDLELGISCRIPAQIEELGMLTAPSKTLAEVLANLPEKSDIALSVDRSHTVHIHSDRSDYKILGLPAEDYPRLPEIKQACTFAIPQATLKDMIRHTIFAVSVDEARAILTGVLLSFEGSKLTCVATDTHRLAVKSANVTSGEGAQNAIVPARAMNELMRLLQDSETDVQVTLSDNQICFSFPGDDNLQLISRLIEGQFPNYARVIPASHDKKITIPVQPLLQAARRAAIVARENSYRIVIRTEHDKLIMTAESRTVGNAYEEIEVISEGDDIAIAFNSKYLLDVLSVLDCEGLNLELSEPLKPGVVRPIPNRTSESPDESTVDSDYLCVLMPMQIV